MKAVQYLGENGGTKGDALRAVGYSEKVAENPQRVFNSPVVRDILASVGISEESTGRVLKRNINARRMKTEYISRTDKTDEELIAEFEEEGVRVVEILRYVNESKKPIIAVRYWVPVYDVSNDALDMAHKLLGAYAPTKSDNRHLVGVFSLSKLRKNMIEKGYSVIDAEIVEETNKNKEMG